MSTEITIPKYGMAMTEGTLTEWLVGDGETVIAGQALCIIESDKSAQEIESPVHGTLRRVGLEGETYPVGHVVGHIE